MIIMALDHVRDLLHATSLTQNPTDMATTTPILFFTRWITHLCAPIFVFLSGVSVYLSYKKTNDHKETRTFLLKRGLWLIVLEFTLINFALWFDFHFRILILQVIAAIGFGFIILAGLLKINVKKLGAIALLIICTHNLLQILPKMEHAFTNTLLSVLFRQSLFQVTPHFMFLIAYPLIPWFAIMLLGFACGRIFEQEEAKRGKLLMRIGIISLTLFTIVRFSNFYGDSLKWGIQKNGLYTFLSFLNVNKYPPSFLFTLLFLGLMFMLLSLAHRIPGKLKGIVMVYGKVPLFYYLLHLFLIRLGVFIMVYIQGFTWNDLLFGPFQFGRPATGSGVSLGAVYIIWILIVSILYPLCKWYANFKSKHTEKNGYDIFRAETPIFSSLLKRQINGVALAS